MEENSKSVESAVMNRFTKPEIPSDSVAFWGAHEGRYL
jgi:hypothetical protein